MRRDMSPIPVGSLSSVFSCVLQAAGFEDVTGRLTPMELTKAWGVSVCQMLHWLAHKALKRRGGDAEKTTVYVSATISVLSSTILHAFVALKLWSPIIFQECFLLRDMCNSIR